MQKNIGKNKKKQTSKPEKPSVTTNEPPNILWKFIKDANLVPFDANLSFGLPYIAFGGIKSFLPWADEHNLKQYPELFSRLSNEVNDGCCWESAFTEIRKNREFMKLLVEITEKFQKELERERKELERERIMRLGMQVERERGIEPPKNCIFQKRKMNFKFTTEKTFFGDITFFGETKKVENENYELAKRLYNIAFDFFCLTLDENYRGNLSLGIFSDVIEGTDFRRLKKCIVCSNIFWAYRLNAKFCDKTCSNTHHQKLLRNNPIKNELVNARRSKTRFDKQVDEAKKVLRNAKTNTEKSEAQKCLQLAISKRINAAQKLNNLTQELGRSRKNGTL